MKQADGVIIVSEIEDQVHLNELVESFNAGFIYYNDIGAGLFVLTKKPMTFSNSDEYELSTIYRNKPKDIIDLKLQNGLEAKFIIDSIKGLL